HGVPQLRPRFVLVAMRPLWARWFRWPEPRPAPPPTVGEALGDLMASRGWPGAASWARRATGIAPTIVGGSKQHSGPALGPTRGRRRRGGGGGNGARRRRRDPGAGLPGGQAAQPARRHGGPAPELPR